MEDPVLRRIQKKVAGNLLNIKIQLVTPELVEPVIQHMYDHFLTREPLCAYTKILFHPESLDDIVRAWRKFLGHGAGMVALLETEAADPAPVVIAANVTFIMNKNDPSIKCRGDKFKLVLRGVEQMYENFDIYEHYGVDSVLEAFGLSVHRDFHGLGLGRALLQCRETVCQRLGLPMTATVFTAASSTHIADSEGFETPLEYDYKEFLVDGEPSFSGIDGKISLMVKRYSH